MRHGNPPRIAKEFHLLRVSISAHRLSISHAAAAANGMIGGRGVARLISGPAHVGCYPFARFHHPRRLIVDGGEREQR
ncbi:hypothetical protein DSM43518_01199 [Mycobacterium marinum]|nr:hypothetical protein MM1218R_00460 [Mycobacterium marinum]AXN47881.1 hypothetical protein CCUG20998_00457 [Mycobacterium marinum]RFZ01871.1 hypothetical protein VIMS_05634 [Mycobacterium marinum]RFZ08146.1 hypothetical protein DE4381_02362 [Mycobacterium marinum]RFZ13345.1 hypothetical protein DSM43518_01199 [Mycobacterium marinum]